MQKVNNNRMEKIFDLGIGLVASVPFDFQEQRGIVLYYSRSTANTERLRSASNERYMIASADLIGAVYCIRKARSESASFRRSMFKEAIKKVKKEFAAKKPSFASMILDEEAMAKLAHFQDSEGSHQKEDLLNKVDGFCKKGAKAAIAFGKRCYKR